MKEQDELVDYRWKLGMITREESCFTSMAGYKKPILLASKIIKELVQMSKKIWTVRNQELHSVNRK